MAVCPGVNVAVEEDPEAIPTLKSCPVPVKFTLCGLPGALSVIARPRAPTVDRGPINSSLRKSPHPLSPICARPG